MQTDKLTVPDEVQDTAAYYPTGNEFVSLPLLDRAAAVHDLNVLHMASKGMLEFHGSDGAPLLAPVVRVAEGPSSAQRPPSDDGDRSAVAPQSVDMSQVRWERLEYWLPRFHLQTDLCAVEGTVYAPPGHKGFVYTLEVQNTGDTSLTLQFGWHGSWAGSRQRIYRGRPVFGRRLAWYDRWTDTLAFELGSGSALAAFALGSGRPLDTMGWYLAAAHPADDTHAAADPVDNGAVNSASPVPIAFERALTRLRGTGPSEPVRADNETGPAIQFALADEQLLQPGERARLDLYVAVNAESDGACTTVVDLQRHGAPTLLKEARAWLNERSRPVTDTAMSELLNVNLWFNYFFAAGRTIDTEDLVLVTSRSPRYYVSAAFWARDAYLWSFPGMLLVDPERAREMVLAGFGRYLRHAGVHSLYIDGTVLYPGFELDELCAYILVLEQYVRATEDYAVLEELGAGGNERVIDGVAYLEKLLEDQRNPERNLYGTFLSPTDDPVTHPYLTYNNAMAWRALRALALLKRRRGDSLGEWRANQQAAHLRETVRKHCVVEGPFGPMFAWALDDNRRAQLLDQPPGSLQLLAYYGFCEPDDPVYVNTVNWIHSEHNPDYCPGAFAAPGCEHAPHPWPMAAAYDLLIGPDLERGLRFFSGVTMDNGIACETVDRETGRVKTGAGFATAAGIIGYALYRGLAEQ